MRKSIKSTVPAPIVTTFTRAEFQLLTSLLEDEANTELAKVNKRYAQTLSDLHDRLNAVAYPANAGFAHDAVTVSAP